MVVFAVLMNLIRWVIKRDPCYMKWWNNKPYPLQRQVSSLHLMRELPFWHLLIQLNLGTIQTCLSPRTLTCHHRFCLDSIWSFWFWIRLIRNSTNSWQNISLICTWKTMWAMQVVRRFYQLSFWLVISNMLRRTSTQILQKKQEMNWFYPTLPWEKLVKILEMVVLRSESPLRLDSLNR